MLLRSGKILLASLIILALVCGAAMAAKPVKNIQPLSPVEQDANLANSVAKVLGFSVDSEKVTALREKNYGYGEIALVFSFAYIGHKTSSEVIALRDSKLGWGAIAKQLNVTVGQGMNGVSKIMKEMKMDEETEKLREAIDKEPKTLKKK